MDSIKSTYQSKMWWSNCLLNLSIPYYHMICVPNFDDKKLLCLFTGGTAAVLMNTRKNDPQHHFQGSNLNFLFGFFAFYFVLVFIFFLVFLLFYFKSDYWSLLCQRAHWKTINMPSHHIAHRYYVLTSLRME